MSANIEPRYVALASEIRNYIKSDYEGMIRRGGLPSITVLARMFSAGKDNISMALQLLEDDGLVEVRKNDGGAGRFFYKCNNLIITYIDIKI